MYLFYNIEDGKKAIVNTIFYEEPLEEIKANLGDYIKVDKLPKAEFEDKIAILYLDLETKKIFYEYKERPKDKNIVELEERVETLEKSNAELMNLIMMQATPTK